MRHLVKRDHSGPELRDTSLPELWLTRVPRQAHRHALHLDSLPGVRLADAPGPRRREPSLSPRRSSAGTGKDSRADPKNQGCRSGFVISSGRCQKPILSGTLHTRSRKPLSQSCSKTLLSGEALENRGLPAVLRLARTSIPRRPMIKSHGLPDRVAGVSPSHAPAPPPARPREAAS